MWAELKSEIQNHQSDILLLLMCLLAFALRLGPLFDNRFHPDEALYASWGLLIRTGRDVWLSQQSADKPPVLFYLLAVSFHYLWRSEAAALRSRRSFEPAKRRGETARAPLRGPVGRRCAPPPREAARRPGRGRG